MGKEHEGAGIPITAIHINLKDRSITLETEGQTVAKLTLAPEGVIFYQPQHDLEASNPAPASTQLSQRSSVVESPTSEPPASKERKTTVLTGKLKAKPKEGRPDRRGAPTAFARFAAHVEGEDKPHDFIATFHRHTTKLALTLDKEAQITVDGYPHKSNSPKRLDTFSVINLLAYPGKPKAKAENPTDNEPMVAISSIWTQTLQKLKSETRGAAFDTWVKDTRYLGMDGTTAIIQVPTPFAKEWLERRMYNQILSTFQQVLGKDTVDIHFILEGK